MTRRRNGLIFSGLLLLGAALLGWRAHRARTDAEQTVAELAGERARLLKNVATAEARLAAARDRVAALEKPPVEAGEKPASVPAAALPKPRPRLPSADELIRSDPKLETLYLRMMRATNARSLTPYFRRLGLAESQIRELLDAYETLSVKRFDLDAVGAGQDAAGRETVARLKKEAQAEFVATQKRILGPEGYAALTSYQGASTLQPQVTSLAGVAAVEGFPLSPEQGEALTRAFMAASHENTGEGRKQQVIDWPAVDAAARKILSPEQFALFQTTGTGFFNSRWGRAVDEAILKAKCGSDTVTTEPPRG